MSSLFSDYFIGDSVLHVIVEYFLDPYFDEIAKVHYYDDINVDYCDALSACLDHHGIEPHQVIGFEISTHRMYLKKRKYGKSIEIMGED